MTPLRIVMVLAVIFLQVRCRPERRALQEIPTINTVRVRAIGMEDDQSLAGWRFQLISCVDTPVEGRADTKGFVRFSHPAIFLQQSGCQISVTAPGRAPETTFAFQGEYGVYWLSDPFSISVDDEGGLVAIATMHSMLLADSGSKPLTLIANVAFPAPVAAPGLVVCALVCDGDNGPMVVAREAEVDWTSESQAQLRIAKLPSEGVLGSLCHRFEVALIYADGTPSEVFVPDGWVGETILQRPTTEVLLRNPLTLRAVRSTPTFIPASANATCTPDRTLDTQWGMCR